MGYNYRNDINNYLIEVAQGKIDGVSSTGIVARNPSAGNTFEDCWGAGGTMVYPTFDTPETWEILSDDANDTAAGTGMRTLLVVYLDGDLRQVNKIVTLDGTTPVTVSNNCYRPNGIIGLTAGSNEANVGTITMRQVTTNNVRNIILPDIGRSHDGNYTIPADKNGYILTTDLHFPKNDTGTFRNRFRSALVENACWVSGSYLPGFENKVPFEFKSAPPVPGGTD